MSRSHFPEDKKCVELRKSIRRRTFLGGKILFNNQCSVLDCLIRNRSETGFQLYIESPATVPEIFDLEIPENGELYPCTIVWRANGKIGVRLLSE